MRFVEVAVETGTKAELPYQLGKSSFTNAQTYLLFFSALATGCLETMRCSLQLFNISTKRVELHKHHRNIRFQK
jgi:hypothetical protein